MSKTSKTFIGETTAERRIHPRAPLKLWVHYQCLKHGEISRPLESLAQDVGAGGLAMRGDHQLARNQLIAITIYLPPKENRRSARETLIVDEEQGVPVEIFGRGAWCAPLDEAEFISGVQFLDLDSENRRRLKSFLVDYKLDQNDSILYT
jgi:hypothetical protein